MSVSDTHGVTSVAATHVHDALPQDAAHATRKQSHSNSHEKTEDGSIETTVIGEGRMQDTRQAFTITETAPVTQTNTLRSSTSETTSAPGSPAMAKMYLLQHRNSSSELTPSGTPAKLDAPIDPLLAPLDCPRPTPADDQTVPASAAASSTTEPADQLNALDEWDSIVEGIRGKQLVIFLDYDGTLTPIVSQPSAAVINDQQRLRLAHIATKFPVAIVTGRKLETIKGFLNRDSAPEGISSLYFAGSHGFDIDCPPSKAPMAQRHSKTVAEEFLPHLARVRDQIASKLKGMPGSLVEDNKFTVSVHYRNVENDADREKLHAIVREAMQPFERDNLLRLTQGKEVHEIRANFDWHKGAAVNYLMQLMCAELQVKDTREIVPIYIGDDTTDEDAFRTLRSYRTSGTHPLALSIFVRTDDKARPSAATYVVRSPEEVGQVLEGLAQL